jgi:hypothetical protein
MQRTFSGTLLQSAEQITLPASPWFCELPDEADIQMLFD